MSPLLRDGPLRTPGTRRRPIAEPLQLAGAGHIPIVVFRILPIGQMPRGFVLRESPSAHRHTGHVRNVDELILIGAIMLVDHFIDRHRVGPIVLEQAGRGFSSIRVFGLRGIGAIAVVPDPCVIVFQSVAAEIEFLVDGG